MSAILGCVEEESPNLKDRGCKISVFVAFHVSEKPILPNMESYMAKKAKRRPWSTTDVRTLKTAARKKTRASSIARTLKRTEGATRQKAFSLGLSLDSRA
jgi:hypothetical protein